MLGNNETIEGIDLVEVFTRMLEQLPWPSLRAYVQSNSQLLKLCTVGGHRLEPKRRKRIHDFVLKEARKAEFSQAFCSAAFAPWYPVHEEIHKALEDHFHSDEYKEYRGENDLAEDTYVLTDDKFQEFFKLEQLDPWRILLCFSPLQFTKEQADRILSDNEGSAALLRRIQEFGDKFEQLEKERDRANAENERLKAQSDQSAADSQKLKKANRELRAKTASLEKKIESSQTDNKRLRDELHESHRVFKERQAAASSDVSKTVVRVKNDLSRVEEQLASWQAKYEQQRVENRNLQKEIEEARKQIEAEQETVMGCRGEIDMLSSFPNLLLDKFDWPKVGAQMKLTPALQRQFNSLIRRLNYEEDRSLAIEGTLDDFWDSLMSNEKELIAAIAKSNTHEVMGGGVEAYWLSLTDVFEDVRIGLEARCILLKMLHEVFYQVIELGDLTVPCIPRGAPKTKAKKKSK